MRVAYDVELIHYANHPVAFDRGRIYEQPPSHKPDGLWVSVVGEDDWAAWIAQEREDRSALRYAYRVELAPGYNICWITTAEGIDDFHAQYSYEDDFNRHMARQAFSVIDDEFLRRQWPIDWVKVAAVYDGLIIAPYQWSRRLGGPMWYYSWDCASGCIWNTQAVMSLSEKGG